MPFWVYLLHCADRTFYVGHSDDLEARRGSMRTPISDLLHRHATAG
jgi:predicted GIY-YIG superfamily endonuclease